jgi:hypothetical protein
VTERMMYVKESGKKFTGSKVIEVVNNALNCTVTLTVNFVQISNAYYSVEIQYFANFLHTHVAYYVYVEE